MNEESHGSRPIVIIGFMGSGKTTIARELALLLKCEAIDLDEFIRERKGRTPGEIIDQSGEETFRQIETETLTHTFLTEISGPPAPVIALGGGTWMLQRNRDLINKHQGLVIWLDAPFDLCWKRIQANGIDRPLARDETKARMLYADRRPQYALAKFQLQVSGHQSPADLCLELVDSLLTRNRETEESQRQ